MKKLICIFLATLSIAHADTLATTPNGVNGFIVLTDVPCESSSGQFHVYSTSPTSDTLFGCWFSDSSMVHITWKNGSIRSYDFTGWEINKEVSRRMKSKNKNNV